MRKLRLLLLTALFPFSIFAQEVWDLEKCAAYAIANSIDLKQSELSVADAGVLKKMNEQQKLPALSANTSAFTNFGRTIDPTTNDFVTSAFLSNNLSLNASITLYNGGFIKNSIRQSELDQRAFEADKNSMIVTVTLNVVQAYFEALFAEDNYSNAEIQLKTISDQIDQMRKLVAAGSRAQFEIYDLEAQQASSEQQLTIAQNRIDLAMLNLKGVMNISPETEMTLSSPPVDQLTYTDLENDSFDDIYKRVVGARPELEALDLRIESGQIGIDIAKSLGLPSISLSGNVRSNYSNQARTAEDFVTQVVESPVFINGDQALLGAEQTFPTTIRNSPYFGQLDDNFSYGFGVQVSVPILDNYNSKGNQERAIINLENLQYNKEKFIVDMRTILGQYITDARAAKRNLEASEKVLTARQVAFDNAEKRFELGAINSFDYISIQDQLNTARTDQIIAKYDYMLKIKVLDYYQGFPVSLN